MNTSLSNESKSEAFKEKNVSYMTFIISLKSAGDPTDCDHSMLVEKCDEESQDNSIGGLNL
jgi:hypothetical protein